MGKGSRWERKAARKFSMWLVGEENPPALWRTKASGGWEQRERPDVGDLGPSGEWDEGHRFCEYWGVELKHHVEIDFWRFFTRTEPKLIKWWAGIVEECAPYHLAPMLVMKRSRYTTLVVTPWNLWTQEDRATPDRCFGVPSHGLFVSHGLFIMELDDLFAFDPEYTYERVEAWL